MRIRRLRSRIYRLDPENPLEPVYLGGYYRQDTGLPPWQFRLLTAALSALSLALLITAGLGGAARASFAALPYALGYLPCVRTLFAALCMPRGDVLREDDFLASIAAIRRNGAVGAALLLIAACASPMLAASAAAMLAVHILGRKQRYLLA